MLNSKKWSSSSAASTNREETTAPPHPRRHQLDVPLSLGKPSLRRRLEAYYSVVAPDQIRDETTSQNRSSEDRGPAEDGTTHARTRRTRTGAAAVPPSSSASASLLPWPVRFAQIYDKYGGTEAGELRLAAKLAKKYGTTVRLQTVASAPRTSSGGGGPSNDGRDGGVGVGVGGGDRVHRKAGLFRVADVIRGQQQVGSGSLDFASERFDPHFALLKATPEQVMQANPSLGLDTITTSPTASLHARGGDCGGGAGEMISTSLMDRVDQCASLLPLDDPLFRPRPPASSSSSSNLKASTREAGQMRPPKRRSASDAATLYFRGLADPLENGPLSVLHQAVVQRQRIRVLIRYVDGIRGTTTGFVVAFDKHFNLLLRDVEEVYSRRLAPNRTSGPRCHSDPHPNGVLAFMSNLEVELLRRRRMGIAAATTTATATAAAADTARVEAEGASTDADASRSESFPTWSVRRRHMKQVLVRGDNVVLLYRADDERSSWPPSSQSPKFSRHRAARSLRNNVPPAERVGSPGSLINNYAPAASSMIERGREPTQQAGRAKRNNTSSSR